jgi:paraquat-inducible protein B
MSRRANLSLIGVFVLGGAALLLSFVVLFGNLKLFKDTVRFVLYFDTSVSGLNEGAPVLFRGVRVGRVTDIRLEANPQSKEVNIPVFIEIDPERIEQIGITSTPQDLFTTLIQHGLRAKLGIQSYITGQCFIELDFEPESPIKLVQDQGAPLEIPTVRSRLQELSATVERLPIDDLMNKLLSAVEGIEKAVHSAKLQESIVSLNQTLQAVRDTAVTLQSRISPFLDQARSTLSSIQHAAHAAANTTRSIETEASAALIQARSTLSRTETGVDRVSRQVARAAGDARAAFAKLRDTLALDAGKPGQLADTVLATLSKMQQVLEQSRTTLKSVSDLTKPDSALGYELTRALQEVRSAARSLKALADTLERRPEALLRGKSR